MSYTDLKQRCADAQARRRNLLKGEDRKAFDTHYGRQGADGSMHRNQGGAGKGDRRRSVDPLLYDIGYELSFNKELTDEQRADLEREWQHLKAQRV